MENKKKYPTFVNSIILFLSLFFTFQLNASLNKSTSPFESQKKIAIIHSYKSGFWSNHLDDAFTSSMKNFGVNIELISLNYDSESFELKSFIEKNIAAKELAFKAIKSNPDLIIVADDEVANLVMPILYSQKLPVLFTGINQSRTEIPWLTKVPKEKVAGILEGYPLIQTLEMLRKLKPNVKKMSIISSQLETSKIVTDVVVKKMRSKEVQEKFSIALNQVVLSSDWSEWQSKIPQMNKEDDALFILVPYGVRQQKNSDMIPVADMGLWLKDNLSLPTVGIISIHTRIGLLTAICATPEGIGRQTAEMAFRFLSGTPLHNIGVEELRYHEFEVNRNEAKRLKIKIPDSLLDIASFTESINK